MAPDPVMVQPDAHTRLIGWLKIVLPLAALTILSTLFLVARSINPENAIPYADVDVAERLREPRMTAPTYAGITEDGAALTLSAAEARPEEGRGAGSATALTGVLETPDGGRTDLAAAAAHIDGSGRRVLLSGGVTVANSSGWQVESETLSAAMDVTDIATDTLISARGPAGTVTAQSMRLTESPGDPGAYLLVFNGDVKLIYQPPK